MISPAETIKSIIETATSLPAFPNQKPSAYMGNCLVYKIIGGRSGKYHSGRSRLHRTRVQITHITDTYGELQTVVSQVRDAILDSTSFQATQSTDTHREDKNDETGKHYSQVDFYIHWRE